jgi:hypothetical protein
MMSTDEIYTEFGGTISRDRVTQQAESIVKLLEYLVAIRDIRLEAPIDDVSADLTFAKHAGWGAEKAWVILSQIEGEEAIP